MSDAMNKSLDDAIKDRKKVEGKTKKGGKPGAKRATGGPKGRLQRTRGKTGNKATNPRRNTGRTANRTERNRPQKAGRKPISKLGVESKRFIKRTRAGGDRKPRAEGQEKPAAVNKKRLRVTNLDFNITHKDLMDLFSKFGSLVKNMIDYDDLGRSKGNAIIEYDKHESALKAIEEYNGATLDGKTLTVEFDVAAKRNVPKVGKKVIVKRDIRPVRRETRGGDRRDNRRDTRSGDRRDNRRDTRSGDRRDNRRQGGDRRDTRNGDNRRRDNRDNRNRRGRGGDRRGRGRGGNRRNND